MLKVPVLPEEGNIMVAKAITKVAAVKELKGKTVLRKKYAGASLKKNKKYHMVLTAMNQIIQIRIILMCPMMTRM
jgi:hypothetical protein